MPKKANALKLNSYIKQNGLDPVYVLVGDDRSLLSFATSAIKNNAETDEMPGSTATEYDEVEDPRDVFDELYTKPFMGMEGRRVIIIREASDFIRDNDQMLLQYINNPSTTGVLVLCCEKLDKRRKIDKTLLNNAVQVECKKISWRDAKRWITDYGRARKKTLTNSAARAVVKAVGPNLSALKNEMDKLILYVEDEKTITLDHIEKLVPNSRQRSIFNLSRAIARGNVREAVDLGEQLLRRGEAPEAIIGFLSKRIRVLWQVKRLTQKDKSPKQIASTVSIPLFAARNSQKAVKNLEQTWFADRLHILAEADYELKTTSLPARSRPIWLAQFLAKLCTGE